MEPSRRHSAYEWKFWQLLMGMAAQSARPWKSGKHAKGKTVSPNARAKKLARRKMADRSRKINRSR